MTGPTSVELEPTSTGVVATWTTSAKVGMMFRVAWRPKVTPAGGPWAYSAWLNESTRSYSVTLPSTRQYEIEVEQFNYGGTVKGVSAALPPPPPPPPTPPPPVTLKKMIVGADIGGWGGVLFSKMAAEGLVWFRTSTMQFIPEAATHGLKPATVIFGTGGTITNIDPVSYAANVFAQWQKYKFPAVEVLNEPEGKWFWSDAGTSASYEHYLALLKATAGILKGTGCEVLASFDGGVGGSVRFGERIKALGAMLYCDGVTAHPYGGKEGQYGGGLGDRNKIKLCHEISGKPVSITEWGEPTAVGQPPTGDSQQHTEEQQEHDIAAMANWCREQGYVSRLIYYNLINEADTGSAQYGAWKHTLTPKLGAKALSAAAAV